MTTHHRHHSTQGWVGGKFLSSQDEVEGGETTDDANSTKGSSSTTSSGCSDEDEYPTCQDCLPLEEGPCLNENSGVVHSRQGGGPFIYMWGLGHVLRASQGSWRGQFKLGGACANGATVRLADCWVQFFGRPYCGVRGRLRACAVGRLGER